jgi:hypothetical protein
MQEKLVYCCTYLEKKYDFKIEVVPFIIHFSTELTSESMYIKPNCPAFRNMKGHHERPTTANAHNIHHSFENHVNYKNPKVENMFPDRSFDIIPPPMSRRSHVRQDPVFDDCVGHNYVEQSPRVYRHAQKKLITNIKKPILSMVRPQTGSTT